MDAAEFRCLDDFLSGMLDRPCRLASPTDGGMKLCLISSHLISLGRGRNLATHLEWKYMTLDRSNDHTR